MSNATPPGACDCHVHVFATDRPTPPGAPDGATVEAYEIMRTSLGLQRAILVQANGYGPDNTAMLNGLRRLGRATTRGVAVVEPGATLDSLKDLAAEGVCGLRFHMLPGGLLGWDALDGLARRCADLGWHVQVQFDGRTLPEHVDQIATLPCPVVIDHIGKFLIPVPVEHPAFRALLGLLERGAVWVKLSEPYGVSQTGAPRYEDVSRLARALVAAAPHRMLWASNWPHVGRTDKQDETALLHLLSDWAPDPDVRRRILVDNPAEVYGFAP